MFGTKQVMWYFQYFLTDLKILIKHETQVKRDEWQTQLGTQDDYLC
jgi:hypothetical protein